MHELVALNKNNCKNCYKCIRNCPVKSIEFSGYQANVISEACILCGRCYTNCPQHAKEIRSDLEKAYVMVQQYDQVIISLAPSFVANYPGVSLASMKEALKEIGIFDVEETARGAQYVKDAYTSYLDQHEPDIFITSACHSVNLLIQKYYPESLKYLAPIQSPMQAHALDIKKRYKDAKVIFVGPCIAKKDEVDLYEGIVDCCLTFEELSQWLASKQIVLKKDSRKGQRYRSRFFPTTGGIIKSLNKQRDDYQYIAIDGAESCMAVLSDISKGHISKCFIEMSMCEGSCVGGPVMESKETKPLKDYLSIMNYGGYANLDIDLKDIRDLSKDMLAYDPIEHQANEDDIRAILNRMGKQKKSDELNCGSCGYNTCRDKAIAIYQGKADYTMCLPYLKERAESFFHNILDHTPSGIIVLNEQYEIQQFNDMAKKIFNIHHRRDVLGEQIFELLNHKDLETILKTHQNIHHKNVYLAEYKKHIKESIIFDDNYHMILLVIEDISDDIKAKKNKFIMNKQTAEVADKVVEKQMRIVQEIASLLGETAAETKIALTQLKEQMRDE